MRGEKGFAQLECQSIIGAQLAKRLVAYTLILPACFYGTWSPPSVMRWGQVHLSQHRKEQCSDSLFYIRAGPRHSAQKTFQCTGIFPSEYLRCLSNGTLTEACEVSLLTDLGNGEEDARSWV